MKKRWVAVGIIIIFIIGLIGINIWSESTGANTVVEVTNIKQETITEVVLTSGRLSTVDEQSIYVSPENGDIAEIFVKEGDEVEQGTTLFKYENDQLELEKKQNDLNLRSLYLQLDYLKEQLKELDKKLKNDEGNEIIQDEYDQLKLEQQRANIEAELVLLQQEANENKIADLEVKSEISGRVMEINNPTISSSSQIEQQPLITIVSMEKLKVEGTLSEYDILKVKEGQTATLTSDAVPESSWGGGKINYISALPVEEIVKRLMVR
ncbi:periplasmic component of efflux system [Gracilibacillus boraciitolerans JCM 21714]|uniref:Periplasmic component of efflux system n=1 Tax=Gracilibacillus boraciitolerans JCM 21714 TaxID=1298598 RepID=W4VQY3_9BACI|nr:efflux RND transporter periplasmic adaptor subunit [Gracilibacillus boraciitolerans]GAE95458.1 periplasmic component of efflux system [Gracilibacillus boraciitolerans JCM 21714]